MQRKHDKLCNLDNKTPTHTYTRGKWTERYFPPYTSKIDRILINNRNIYKVVKHQVIGRGTLHTDHDMLSLTYNITYNKIYNSSINRLGKTRIITKHHKEWYNNDKKIKESMQKLENLDLSNYTIDKLNNLVYNTASESLGAKKPNTKKKWRMKSEAAKPHIKAQHNCQNLTYLATKYNNHPDDNTLYYINKTKKSIIKWAYKNNITITEINPHTPSNIRLWATNIAKIAYKLKKEATNAEKSLIFKEKIANLIATESEDPKTFYRKVLAKTIPHQCG